MLRTVINLLLLAFLLVAGVRPVGPLPPLRALLDPWAGAWGLASSSARRGEVTLDIPNLDGAAEVWLDDRGVPHVFASSEADAWRLQGWFTARDRLFQLNLQARATAGRLTEWVGPVALQADRRSRQLGLARAAEAQWAALEPGSTSRRAMVAYAEGVNAFLDQLAVEELPLEYRLLGVTPDRWEPQFTLYLFQQMGTVLGLSEGARGRDALAALVGREAAEALVPLNSPLQEPIQPNGQFAPRLDQSRLPDPGLPDTGMRVLASAILTSDAGARGAGEGVGSNNWAVMPRRTASGHALLAGDPHLELTLPAIWHEVHLVVAGGLEVAGATIPGVPGVLIGFNRNLAWSVTNTGADVLDFYRETVDDAASPTRYRLDGEWRDLVLEPTEYRDRRGRVLARDTLRFSHRGPVDLVDGMWISRRWALHETATDPHVFLALNQAASVDEGLVATAGFPGPAQNFIMADRAGSIAIRSTGRYPIRPGDGRGDQLFDGATSASDWQGWIPADRYPQARNPPQGYLASANQQPVDPRLDGAYFGADWPAPWRAIRINQLLRADSAVTPEAMRFYQTDPGSPAADLFTPQFLRAGREVLARDSSRVTLARAIQLLSEWDRRYTLDSRRAVLFEEALQQLSRLAWDELIRDGDSLPVRTPSQEVLAALLEEPSSTWWDDRRTPEAEDRDAILVRALESGLERTTARLGEPDSPGWRWTANRQMNIHHLLRMRPLSRLGIAVASGTGTLSPSGGGSHGASWRMVVELGEPIRAWATYPGGQSGNPLSSGYSDRLPLWEAGDLAEVLLPGTPAAFPADRVVQVFRAGPRMVP